MGAALISRWARRFLLVGIAALVASQGAALAGLPRRTEILLGLLGFVLVVVFGKAYSLVPSYFDRSLALPYAPLLHLPLATLGVLGLAGAEVAGSASWLAPAGATAWGLGVVVFLGALGLTVWDNPTGAETGTSDANADRETLDRIANAFIPVALGYLLLGTWELLGPHLGLPLVFDGYVPRAIHLLGAGFAVLVLFAVGFRLLPRFLAVSAPTPLALVVLPAGAIGPLLLAWGLPTGPVFRLGAALEGLAVVGFAIAVFVLVGRSEKERVGFYGPQLGMLAGVAGVGLGVWFAVGSRTAALTAAHVRLNVLGLLGLTIVGVIYQFYPPAVAQWPGSGDALAGASLAGMAAGVAALAVGAITHPLLAAGGHVLMAVAGLAAGYQVLGTIRAQTTRH